MGILESQVRFAGSLPVWTLRLVLASAFVFVFAFCAVFVPFAAMLTARGYVVRGEDKHCSTTPLIGSIAGVVAIVVAPLATFGARVVWIGSPLVLELGVLVLVGLVWRGLRLDRP